MRSAPPSGNAARDILGRPPTPPNVRLLTAADTLDGGTVVPGWTVPVAALFEDDDEPTAEA